MATLPTQEDLGSRPVPQASTSVASYQPGQVAGALQNMGAHLNEVSQSLAQVQQSEIETQVNDQYVNGYAPYAAQQKAKFQSLQGGDAVKPDTNGVTPMQNYINSLQEERQKMRDAIPGTYGKQLFDQRAGRHVEGELESAAGYAVNQQKAYDAQTQSGLLSTLTDQASNNINDPHNFQMALNSMNAAIEDYGHKPSVGWPQSYISEQQQKNTSQVWISALTRLAESDPQGALAKYRGTDEQPGAIQQIDGSMRAQIENHLVTKANQAEQSSVANSFLNGIPVTAKSGNNFNIDPTEPLEKRASDAIQMASFYADDSHPGDSVFKDQLLTHVKSDFNTAMYMDRMQKDKTLGDMMGFLSDANGNPQSFTQAMADPTFSQSYNSLPLVQQRRVQSAFQGQSNMLTPDSARLVDNIKGMAVTDPVAFKNYDIGSLVGKIPQNELEGIINMRASIDKNSAKNMVTQTQVTSVAPVMSAAGIIDKHGKKTEDYLPFVGKFQQAVSDWQAANKRVPNTSELTQIASGLTATVPTKGVWFGTNQTPAYKVDKNKIAMPQTADDLQNVPSGTVFINPADGKKYIKK